MVGRYYFKIFKFFEIFANKWFLENLGQSSA